MSVHGVCQVELSMARVFELAFVFIVWSSPSCGVQVVYVLPDLVRAFRLSLSLLVVRVCVHRFRLR